MKVPTQSKTDTIYESVQRDAPTSGEAIQHSAGRSEKVTSQLNGPMDTANQNSPLPREKTNQNTSSKYKLKSKLKDTSPKTSQSPQTSLTKSKSPQTSLTKSKSPQTSLTKSPQTSQNKSPQTSQTKSPQSSQTKEEKPRKDYSKKCPQERTSRLPKNRNSWHSVERGPTLILPTTCKFLDNIENNRKDTPESPKRLNSSPKRTKSPSSNRSSPSNSPKTSIKNKRRWSTYMNYDKDDLELGSNSRTPSLSPSPSRPFKSAPSTPLKVKRSNSKNESRKSMSDIEDNRILDERPKSEDEKQDTEAGENPKEKKTTKDKDSSVFRFFKPSYR